MSVFTKIVVHEIQSFYKIYTASNRAQAFRTGDGLAYFHHFLLGKQQVIVAKKNINESSLVQRCSCVMMSLFNYHFLIKKPINEEEG